MSTATPARTVALVGALTSLVLAGHPAEAQPIGWARQERKVADCGSVVLLRCAEARQRSDRDSLSRRVGDAAQKLEQARGSDDAWSLGRVVIEGEAIRRPTIRQVFEANLGNAFHAITFKTEDLGGGVRCTTVLPYGYRECSKSRSGIPKALDGPWR